MIAEHKKIISEIEALNKSVKIHSVNERQTTNGKRLDLIMNFINDAMITKMLQLGYDFSYVDVHTQAKIRVVFDILREN